MAIEPEPVVDACRPRHAAPPAQVPPGLSLRRLGREDAGKLREARLMALKESPEGFATDVDKEKRLTQRQWRRLAESSTWVLATNGDTILGLAQLVVWPATPDARFVQSVWVAKAHRGQGIVEELITFLEHSARDSPALTHVGDTSHNRSNDSGPGRVDRLLLWVFADNDRARQAYRRLGFHEIGQTNLLGTWRGEVEECLMERKILPTVDELR